MHYMYFYVDNDFYDFKAILFLEENSSLWAKSFWNNEHCF